MVRGGGASVNLQKQIGRMRKQEPDNKLTDTRPTPPMPWTGRHDKLDWPDEARPETKTKHDAKLNNKDRGKAKQCEVSEARGVVVLVCGLALITLSFPLKSPGSSSVHKVQRIVGRRHMSNKLTQAFLYWFSMKIMGRKRQT
jgi:hypothetical protein